MKKSLSFLAVMILLLGLFPVFAYADLLTPEQAFFRELRSNGALIIAAAVLVIAFILWRVLRKKK